MDAGLRVCRLGGHGTCQHVTPGAGREGNAAPAMNRAAVTIRIPLWLCWKATTESVGGSAR